MSLLLAGWAPPESRPAIEVPRVEPEKSAEEKRAELGFRPWRRLGVEPGSWYPKPRRVFRAIRKIDSRYWEFECRRGHRRPILAQHVVRGGIRSCSECNKGANDMGEKNVQASHKDAVIAARAWLEHRGEHRQALEKELASLKAREVEISAILDAMGLEVPREPHGPPIGKRPHAVQAPAPRTGRGWPKGKPRGSKKAAPRATTAPAKEAATPPTPA